MRAGGAGGGVPDQYRVYQDITGAIERGEYLRMMVQASAGALSSYLATIHTCNTRINAGTGKSYLLTSVYLWCLVKKYKVLAGAPTGERLNTYGCRCLVVLFPSLIRSMRAIEALRRRILKSLTRISVRLRCITCWSWTRTARRNWTFRTWSTSRWLRSTRWTS